MAETTILLALQARLATVAVAEAVPAVMPRQRYAPTAGAPFLRAWHLPANTRSPLIGNDAPHEHRGVFQVDVMWPSDEEGMAAPLALAEAVIDAFDKGTTLTRDGVTVRVIARPSIGPTFDDNGWSKTPVSVFYLAFA